MSINRHIKSYGGCREPFRVTCANACYRQLATNFTNRPPKSMPLDDQKRTVPVPQVTTDDVERVIRRDFPEELIQHVQGALDEYDTRFPERPRVQLAVLKLSAGSAEKVRENVALANSDYRDVLAPAEYPGFWKLGFTGTALLTEPERKELVDSDWRQYEIWLNK